MPQSRKRSGIEVGTNIAVGLVLAWFGNKYLALWLFGVRMSGSQSVEVVGMFTLLSVVRQYILRRVFNLWER